MLLKVSAHVLLKVVKKGSFRGKKKLWKFRFLGYYSKAKKQKKTEKSDQKHLNFSDKFGMLIPCSDTYYLEVSAYFSLKVATKGSKVASKSVAFSRLQFWSRNREVRPKSLKCLW